MKPRICQFQWLLALYLSQKINKLTSSVFPISLFIVWEREVKLFIVFDLDLGPMQKRALWTMLTVNFQNWFLNFILFVIFSHPFIDSFNFLRVQILSWSFTSINYYFLYQCVQGKISIWLCKWVLSFVMWPSTSYKIVACYHTFPFYLMRSVRAFQNFKSSFTFHS